MDINHNTPLKDGSSPLDGRTKVDQHPKGHGIRGHLDNERRRDMLLNVHDPVSLNRRGINPT
eukprot:2159509-Prorocentrum_lima.AAC.1